MRQWSARQWIGLYEFLAGCAGFGVTLVVTPNLAGQVPVQWRTQFWLAVAAALGMFGVVAAAGVLLMRRHRLGVGLSVVVQALQVPLWAVVGGTRWVFFAGVYLAPLLVDEELT